MQPDATDTASRNRSARATRERILEATNRLFYEQGIRATSADRIIEDVGITKVTFYRHFHSKNDLVVAYLTQQAVREREWFTSMRNGDDPRGSLHAIAAGIGAAACSPGFRGCAFINAAAEFSDPNDPVREVVDAHRHWMLEEFAGIAMDAGIESPDEVAHQFMILRDGGMVNGYLGDSQSVAESLRSAFDSLLAATKG